MRIIKKEDVAFWIFILTALAIVLWMLHGSPTLEQAIMSFIILIISSEFLLWKNYYEMDKNTAVAFSNVRNDISQLRSHADARFESLERLLKK